MAIEDWLVDCKSRAGAQLGIYPAALGRPGPEHENMPRTAEGPEQLSQAQKVLTTIKIVPH